MEVSEESTLANVPDASLAEEYSSRAILESKSNNLYNFSMQAAQHASYYSSSAVSTISMYQMLCDAVSSVLIPEHHVSCKLRVEERREQVRGGYENKLMSLGSRSETVFSEVLHVCKNYVTQDFTFLRPYMKTHHSLHIFKYTVSAIEALVKEDEAFLDDPTFSLLYGSFSEHFEAYKDFSNEDKPLAMYFIEEHPALYAALSDCDRKKFFEAMRDIALRDFSVTRNIFCVLAQHILTFRSMYNNLLLCALLYSRDELSQCPEQKHYLAHNATIAINVLLKFNPKFQREVSKLLQLETPDTLVERITSHADVVTILGSMGGDIAKLVSIFSAVMPVLGDVDSSKFSSSNDLEKIAAMHLILYPGSAVHGEDILIGNEKLVMLNIGSLKIKSVSEPATIYGERHKKIAIMEDIQKIFSSLQELCGHLDCETFIEELRTYCAMMRSQHYAAKIQHAISQRIEQLPEHTKLNGGDLPTVAFESILPRIEEIEEFLQDERMVQLTIQFTKLLHNSEKLILSAPDFLRICGYLDINNASFINDCVVPTSLLEHIEQNSKHFSSMASKGGMSPRLPSPTPGRRETDPELCSNQKYKISTLSTKERNSAFKQLSARSISRRVYHVLVRISPVLALISITFIICFALSYGEMSIASALMVPISCAFIVFLATYIREEATKAEKKYIMSLPPSGELVEGIRATAETNVEAAQEEHSVGADVDAPMPSTSPTMSGVTQGPLGREASMSDAVGTLSVPKLEKVAATAACHSA